MSSAAGAAAAGRVLPGRYVDSVLLMQLARQLSCLAGVTDAAALMGTDANKALLVEGGFDTSALVTAGVNDLMVAVRAVSTAAAAAALQQVDDLLTRGIAPTAARHVKTLGDALVAQPESNLAVISLPGEYAAGQARHALELGLHAFVFSSGVSLEDEIALKQMAHERGLLCMGPDCGTALIGGRGIGFANVVHRGPVGVVGASGTGIQAITSLLDEWDVGVSHAIGAGSRDGGDAVGGVTMLDGLRALDADPQTTAIVLVSKPVGPETAARLRDQAATSATPVVLCFLGDAGDGPATLEEAARRVAEAAGRKPQRATSFDRREIRRLRSSLSGQQRWIRGLYAGGTLGYEAQVVLSAAGLSVYSNAPLRPELRLGDASRSVGHAVVDLGTEEFTRGRPHPMIDARVRRSRLRAEAEDPTVAVILLDFVLGYGAAADPAGDLADAIAAARASAHSRGDELIVVASVCGTAADPQDLNQQRETLRASGAILAATNAQAARLASRLVERVLS